MTVCNVIVMVTAIFLLPREDAYKHSQKELTFFNADVSLTAQGDFTVHYSLIISALLPSAPLHSLIIDAKSIS